MDAATADSLLTVAEEARAAMRQSKDATGIGRFEDRYGEIREALDWYLDAGRADDAFRLAAALVPFWLASKRVAEGIAWLEGALTSPLAGDAARARGLHDHGYLAFFSGGYDVAERRFAESRQHADRAGDRNLAALALAGSARVALNEDPEAAVRLTREAMGITQDLPDSQGRSSAEHVLGVALQLSGDLAAARDVMWQRIQHAREVGNDFVIFVESANLSMVERKLGNLDAAQALSLDALRIAARAGDQMAIPWVINGLAAVTAAKGNHEHAASLLAIAESLISRAGGEWPADEREQYEGTLDAVSAVLSPAALEAARTRAAGLSLDASVTMAMHGEDEPRGEGNGR